MRDSLLQLITPLDTRNYQELVSGLASASWPEFMLHDPVADDLWDNLFTYFPEYQFALLDTRTGRAAAMGNSLALHWDGDPHDLPAEGWDWAFIQAVADHSQGLQPRTQCAIQIAIHPDYRNQGLSNRMVQIMREVGEKKGFKRLIAPVRPNQKSLYPLIDMDDYISWKNEQGLPFDAWLRTHVRAGATIIKTCRHAMDIRGTRADWETWTGLKFLQSAEYVLPGGLIPMKMDLESDLGIYIEPNVWMVHELAAGKDLK
ncbi:MAG: GNAT family N-acetyltransferase [Chloroflexi bacterium]|nr:GNAT family N-acetyltransferase [Chloroflexota bacterium]